MSIPVKRTNPFLAKAVLPAPFANMPSKASAISPLFELSTSDLEMIDSIEVLSRSDEKINDYSLIKFINQAICFTPKITLKKEYKILEKNVSFLKDTLPAKYHPFICKIQEVLSLFRDDFDKCQWITLRSHLDFLQKLLLDCSDAQLDNLNWITGYFAYLNTIYNPLSETCVISKLLFLIYSKKIDASSTVDKLKIILKNLQAELVAYQAISDFETISVRLDKLYEEKESVASAPVATLSRRSEKLYVQEVIQKIDTRAAFSRVETFFRDDINPDFPQFSTVLYPCLNKEELSLRKKALTTSALEATSFISSGKKISWLTGTNHYTLIGMALSKIKMGLPAYELIPTGELLKANIAPLCGELEWGITKSGINLKALSGVIIQFKDTAKKYAFRNPTKLQCHDLAMTATISELFSLREPMIEGSEKELYIKKMNTLINIFNILNPSKFLKLQEAYFKNITSIYILRALDYGLFENSEIEIIKKEFLKFCLLSKDEFTVYQKIITDDILPLFDTPRVEIEASIRSLLNYPVIPLIFAAAIDLADARLVPVHSDIKGEYGFTGHLQLGKDITAAFTDSRYVNLINDILKPHGVMVMSLESLDVVSSYQ